MEKNYIQINPVIQECYEQLQQTASRKDGICGIESGFHSLDKFTSGWQNGELIVIASRPAMGKSAFALSMIRNMAVNAKTPTLLFSLEMNSVQIVNRMIVNVCGIPGEKIKNGQLAPHEWGQLDFKIKELYDAPLFIEHTPGIEIEQLCDSIRKAVIEDGVKIVIIDYIQRISVENGSFDKRYLEVNYITRRLKDVALELNVPIIALSQMNRGVESREGIDGKCPQLIDLRDSGTLEEDADMVIFIHRPEYYKIFQDRYGNDLRGVAEIIIAKHRNGALGDVLLRFKSEYARFDNPNNDIIIPMPGEPKEENGNSTLNLDEWFGKAPF